MLAKPTQLNINLSSDRFAMFNKERDISPYTPKTNGKAERFIQTALREWAYARAYQNSDQRAAELPNWLHRYNWHQPPGSLKAHTPISRLGLSENNLLKLHS